MFKKNSDEIIYKADLIGVKEEVIDGQIVKVKVYGPPKAYKNGQLLTKEEPRLAKPTGGSRGEYLYN